MLILAAVAFLALSGPVALRSAGPWVTQPDLLDRYFGPEPFTLDPRPDFPFRMRYQEPFGAASAYLTADAQAMLFRARIMRLGGRLTGAERTLGPAEIAEHAAKIVGAMLDADGVLPFVSLQAMVRAGVGLEWADQVGPLSPDTRAVACAVVMHALALEEVQNRRYRERPAFNSVLRGAPAVYDKVHNPDPAPVPGFVLREVDMSAWGEGFRGRERFRDELVVQARELADRAGLEADFARDLELHVRMSVAGSDTEPLLVFEESQGD